MSNPRKVQQEIDKLMKKVQEGMDVYEGVFDKVQNAADRVQKEKFEAELKKEIKKLQRLREQIKGLHASPEVKDKKQLEVTRRAIEVKMEGFKVCERETKTKAFSKEGLATNKTDPAARAKAKTQGWINTAIQELQDQIEQLEFDIENEAANGGGTKKKGKKQDAGGEREERMKRNKYHILKLESILRVLEMGELEPEDVDEIEPEVQNFVEGFQDATYEEDEEMDPYEMFDIPDMVDDIQAQHAKDDSSSDDEDDAAAAAAAKKAEAAAAAAASPAKAKDTPPQKVAPKPAAKKALAPDPAVAAKKASPAVSVKQPPPVPIAPKTPLTPLTAKGPASPGMGKSMADMLAGNKRGAEQQQQQPPAATAAKQPQAQQQQQPAAQPPTVQPVAKAVVTPVSVPAPASVAAPPAAAAAQSSPPPSDAAPAAASGMALEDDGDDNNDDTFGDDAMEGVTAGGGNLADLAGMTAGKLGGGLGGGGQWGKPLPPSVGGINASGAANALSNAPSLPPAVTGGAKAAPSPVLQTKPLPSAQQPVGAQEQADAAAAVAAAAVAAAGPSARQGASSPPANAGAAPGTTNSQPGATAGRPAGAPVPSAVIQNMLNVSMRNLPHTSDCERPKPYTPPNPYSTPDYYPQSVHPSFSIPETFTRFEPDTLFFIFYYQQASYQQYLAAKELKRQSWRFHKKYQTWFQRHDRPKVTTDQHEQGTYIYFDYDGGWCQRIKADFVFQYAQLEDSLV